MAIRRRDFTREADDVHAVGTIGGDVEVEHFVAIGQPLDAFEREATQRELRADFFASRVDVDELAQPGQQDLHNASMVAGNCSRNRRSFS